MKSCDAESGVCLANGGEKSPPESEPLRRGKSWVRSSLERCLAWSGEHTAPVPRIAAAALGMAVPVAVGTFAGRPGVGMLAAMGGLALSGAGGGQTQHEQGSRLAYTLLSGSAAMLAGACLSGLGTLAMLLFPVMAGLVARAGSISRPMARTAPHFILYTIIAMHYDLKGLSPMGLMLLFMAGAGWYAAIAMVFNTWMTGRRRPPHSRPSPVPTYTARQLLRRWSRTLGHLRGWRYALRMTICLAAAESYQWIWPHHHGYWALITVVVVLQRDVQAMPAKMRQRSVGTLAGALIAGVLFLGAWPAYAAVALIGLLAAGRVALREVNYTAYTVVMTVLIIILLDFGSAPSVMTGVDRFLATLAGCVVSTLLGYLPWGVLDGTEAGARPPVKPR